MPEYIISRVEREIAAAREVVTEEDDPPTLDDVRLDLYEPHTHRGPTIIARPEMPRFYRGTAFVAPRDIRAGETIDVEISSGGIFVTLPAQVDSIEATIAFPRPTAWDHILEEDQV